MNPLKPILDYLDKARSHIYGIFLFWIAVGFSPVIFSAFFVDQRIIFQEKHLPKNEYIRQTFFNFTCWSTWAYLILVVVGAYTFTWLMIWKLPKWVVNPAYEWEVKDYYARERMKLEEEESLGRRKENNIVSKQLKTVEQAKTAQEEQEQLESKERSAWGKNTITRKGKDFMRRYQLEISSLPF